MERPVIKAVSKLAKVCGFTCIIMLCDSTYKEKAVHIDISNSSILVNINTLFSLKLTIATC